MISKMKTKLQFGALTTQPLLLYLFNLINSTSGGKWELNPYI